MYKTTTTTIVATTSKCFKTSLCCILDTRKVYLRYDSMIQQLLDKLACLAKDPKGPYIWDEQRLLLLFSTAKRTCWVDQLVVNRLLSNEGRYILVHFHQSFSEFSRCLAVIGRHWSQLTVYGSINIHIHINIYIYIYNDCGNDAKELPVDIRISNVTAVCSTIYLKAQRP